MTWTVADLDEVIQRAKANRRSGAYVAALERRRAALMAGAAEKVQETSAVTAEAILDRFTEAVSDLLEIAHLIGKEDGRFVGEILDCLASWFPLVGEDDAEAGGAVPGANVMTFPERD